MNTSAPHETRQGDLILPPTKSTGHSSKKRNRAHKDEPKRTGFLGYLILFAITILAFGPMFQSDVLWSDYDMVERTPYSSMENWKEAWSIESIKRHNPIALSSYFLESHLPLPEAKAYRLVNLCLHLLASLLLLKILENLKLRGAYASALVFAVHPAALQTLFWSGYRHELVGLVLILTCLFFGVRNRGIGDFFTVLILASIASFSHSAALVLPLLLGLCIFYQNKAFHLYHYNRALPVFCVALFIGVWTHSGQIAEPVAKEVSTLTMAGQNIYFYLQQSFFPLELKLFHPFAEKQRYNVGATSSLLAFFIFVPFYVLIAFNYRKRWARGLLLGLSSFILLLLYGIFHTGRFIDGSLAKEAHALYVALPAAVAIAFCSAAGFLKKKRAFGSFVWQAFLTVFILVQVGLTTSFSFAVGNPTQMWKNMASEWDDAWQPKAALVESARSSGSELLNESNMITVLLDIVETNPERIQERIYLARLYRETGQNANALREYKRILRDTKPEDEFLEEAADFFDSLNLRWEAKNTRERMSNSTKSD